MKSAIKLSKSRYTAGLQCEKRLWLEVHRRDLMDEVDESTQAIFDQGHVIGELAQTLYPGGVLISEDHLHIDGSIASTEKAVKTGVQVIYEAGAELQGVRARADIMAKNPDGTWDMIEVKSTSKVKDTHLDDLAIQRFIFEGAGYKIRKTYLCHMDTTYVRKGPVDVKALFKLVDTTAEVNKRLSGIPEKLKSFFDLLADKTEPIKAIGRCCSSPYGCSFTGYCWKDVPKGSVFELYMGGRKAEGLYHEGVIFLKDIPARNRLTSLQALQVKVAKSGQPHWNITGIRAFLKKITYPVAYLDFETFNPAVPLYDGTRPFQKIPFQYSVHLQEKPGGPLVHAEYLADGENNPQAELAKRLIADLGTEGTVLSYSSFENTVLNLLCESSPELQKPLKSIAKRIVDLASPFRWGHVLYSEFAGSWSIKNVLPVLVPGMSYEDLEVGEGMAAVGAFNRFRDPKTSSKDKAAIRKNLLEYCGQDTMAMVKLFEVLVKAVERDK